MRRGELDAIGQRVDHATEAQASERGDELLSDRLLMWTPPWARVEVIVAALEARARIGQPELHDVVAAPSSSDQIRA